MAHFYRKYSRSSELSIADAQEFLLDALSQSIGGLAGGTTRLKATKLDESTVRLVVSEQVFIVRLEEAAKAHAAKVVKRSAKKSAKPEGSGNVQ
jgi:hypothetical protein